MDHDMKEPREAAYTEPGVGGGDGHQQRTVTDLPTARALTRARAHDLRELLLKYIHRHLPSVPRKRTEVAEPPRRTGPYARLLPLLQLIPWLLAALFAFSFWWDFPGVSIEVWGAELPLAGVLRIVAVSGLIGFFTNWLAITMLFNPRQKRPIFGQGLIPSQRERVIYRLAKAVSEELINEEIIKQKIEQSGVITRYRELAMEVTRGVLEDPDFRAELKSLTAEYVDTVLSSEQVRVKIAEMLIERVEHSAGEGFGGVALKAYRFFNEDDFQRRINHAVHQIPLSMDKALDGLDHLLDRVPAKVEARSEEIEAWVTRIVLGFVENLNVYEMIVGNMKRYDEQQLERLLKNTSNEQLNYIKYLGGVLGCIGGFVIWQPLLALAAFGTLGAGLYAVDELLFRRRTAAH